MYIFVEDKVYTEFFTWQKNRDNTEINYSYVDNPKIYMFLEKVYELPANNQIVSFSKTSEIIEYLKEQWSGLFHEYLIEETKKEEISLAIKLKEQIENFNNIIEYLKENNEKIDSTLKKFEIYNNNFLSKLREILRLPQSFYVKNISDLDKMLNAMYYFQDDSYYYGSNTLNNYKDYYNWKKIENNNNSYYLRISKNLFDETGNIKKNIDEIFNENSVLNY